MIIQSSDRLARAWRDGRGARHSARRRSRSRGPRFGVGYLHTLAVDGQIWLANHLGAFGKNGLEPEFVQFTTGLELFQAMIGGSLDMLTTGAVISNFPARGQGKMFLANAVEFATAQLWVREDQGIKSFADLKGKRIATTARHDRARVSQHGAARQRTSAATDIELAQPAHARRGDGVHLRRGAGRRAVGAVQHHGPRQGAGSEEAGRCLGLLSAGRHHVGAGRRATDFHSKNREVLARVITRLVGGQRLPDGQDRRSASRRCRRSTTRRCSSPISRSSSSAQKVFTVSRMAQAVRRRHGDEMAAAGHRFLRRASATSPIRSRPSQYFDPSIYMDATKA